MKKIVSILASFVIASSAFAQMTVNPAHSFYTDLQNWQIRKIVKSVPPVRPYPLLTIKDLLLQVMEKGSEKDKELAELYYEELTGGAVKGNIEAEFTYKNIADEADEDMTNESDSLVSFYPGVQGQLSFLDDFIGFGYKFGFAVRSSRTESDYFSYTGRTAHDAIQDPAVVKGACLYLDTDEVITMGNRTVFLQGGIFRNGFGSFIGKGLALNDLDYHKGSISLTYAGENLRYNQQINVIGASSSYDGNDLWPNKVLAFHCISYDFFDWLTFTYYENIVYGKRLDFSYILPAPYMACQGIGGNSDNLQMGLVFDIKPFNGILWSTDVFVDDFDVNQLAKLNLDTKLRLGIQTGLIYVPEDSFIKRLSLDWTIVTPFTYTHWDYDSANREITAGTINYQNYTNSGTRMGSLLEPNSDALCFAVCLNPVKNLDITIGTSYIRHGNVTESLGKNDAMTYLLADSGVYATDGTVYQHTMFDGGEHVDGAWNKLNLFTQEHQMYVVQAGVSGEYRFPKIGNRTQLSVKAGWTFEFIKNYGVDNPMYPGGLVRKAMEGDVQKTDGGGNLLYTYAGEEKTAEEIIKSFKDDWVSKLTDRLNNYFTVGLCVRF